jgi:putative membrane protein
VTEPQAIDRRFAMINSVVSTLVVGFLAWLLFADRAGIVDLDLSFMPAVNASLNATAFVCLTAGWIAIKRGNRELHPRLMAAALVCSSLFLVGYVFYHYVHGDTRYTGANRTIYLAVLASHVILSVATVPLAFATVFYAWRKRYDRHRGIARITLPIWLYVSATGVIVYFLLRGDPPAH